ncbi:hypothetical protein C8Q73DRAFT_692190 [Cubamyces lactineus]|nr:hypothetical protein C8Q73DRAFT_692190 [Cubamyces lactineus]
MRHLGDCMRPSSPLQPIVIRAFPYTRPPYAPWPRHSGMYPPCSMIEGPACVPPPAVPQRMP